MINISRPNPPPCPFKFDVPACVVPILCHSSSLSAGFFSSFYFPLKHHRTQRYNRKLENSNWFTCTSESADFQTSKQLSTCES